MKKTMSKVSTIVATICLLSVVGYAHQTNKTSANKRFQPNWESISSQYKIPDWYKDAKLGIFIHWGVCTVPAYHDEWYPRWMYKNDEKSEREKAVIDHHVATYGPQDKFGYKDFIPMFKAEKWNPGEWAKLFKRSGAKYVVPVAEHHDGFSMYDSDINPWNSVKMGPKGIL